MSQDTRDFFKELAPLASFADAVNIVKHTELPDDWWVIVADVMDSTKAIAAGRYKEVNTIGASTIVAVINVDRSIEIPYVFGGDGVSCAVPPGMEIGCRRALLGARDLARDAFGMGLRVGMMRVKELRDSGEWVRVAKVTGTGGMPQMLVSGRGWEAAERRLKGPGGEASMAVERPGLTADANFEGLECRWQAVKSENGCKLSIVVVSMEQGPDAQIASYSAILETLHKIYGDVDDFHPLNADRLALTMSIPALKREIAVRTSGRSSTEKLLYTLHLLLTMLIGTMLFRFKIDTRGVIWSRYRTEVVQNSDYRKFDGALKMVIESTQKQRAEKLEAYLEGLYQARRIVYGTHASKAAILTCLVFSYSGKHSHFVDGSDGGYAVAAKGLKERLKERLGK